MAGIKDLAARTAGVTGRSVEKGTEKEPRTAPVMMYDVTTRMHDAEQKAEELQRDLEQVKLNGDRRPVQLALIDDSPFQPRLLYDDEEIDNLAHSMAAAGQEELIKLRLKPNGRYEIVGSGHRRIRAARSIGWVTVDALIVERTDREAELATMVSNEARVDLTDYERGKLYQNAIDKGFASTQTDLAHMFGASQAQVSKRLAMLKLPANYIAMLDARPNLFGVTCAESIAQLLKEYPTETTLIEDGVLRISEEGADQKTVKQWVQQMIKQRAKPAKNNKPKVITNRSGRQIFTAKREGRVIMIRISAQDVDGDSALEKVIESLRQISEAEINNIKNQ